jgi:uroporphyrinogen III methyltransferase/synthase
MGWTRPERAQGDSWTLAEYPTVYLVGAGPGDPGLITARGLELLAQADVVVYDRLAHPALLAEARHARLVDVGKRPDHHPVPQADINQILLDEARQGKRVVRLKGGDPFVFGRGGEEAEALALAGIPFEIVPGVSSAIAVPAYAGIPVTHRNLACSFSVITGHRKADAQDEIECDWQRAAGADTLVFLMGVTALPSIVANLLEIGRDPRTPAAVIERGTFARQRTVTGQLETIAARVAEAGVRPPATLVVGDVVGLREQLRWFDTPDRRPLLGLRVLNTRAAGDAAEFSARLRDLGAEPVALPATRIVPPDDLAPVDAAISALAAAAASAPPFDWVGFTSSHAVTSFADRLFSLGYDARAFAGTKLAAVGPATADALRRYGLAADLVPDRSAGRHLAAALGDVAGKKILLPRSDIALRDLPDALRARGADVTEVVCYATQPAEPSAAADAILTPGELDVVAFFSPSAVAGLAALARERSLADALGAAAITCIGDSTEAAARRAGLEPEIIPEESTTESLTAALVDWARRRRTP